MDLTQPNVLDSVLATANQTLLLGARRLLSVGQAMVVLMLVLDIVLVGIKFALQLADIPKTLMERMLHYTIWIVVFTFLCNTTVLRSFEIGAQNLGLAAVSSIGSVPQVKGPGGILATGLLTFGGVVSQAVQDPHAKAASNPATQTDVPQGGVNVMDTGNAIGVLILMVLTAAVVLLAHGAMVIAYCSALLECSAVLSVGGISIAFMMFEPTRQFGERYIHAAWAHLLKFALVIVLVNLAYPMLHDNVLQFDLTQISGMFGALLTVFVFLMMISFVPAMANDILRGRVHTYTLKEIWFSNVGVMAVLEIMSSIRRAMNKPQAGGPGDPRADRGGHS